MLPVDDPDDSGLSSRPSKSERKREMHERQQLGERLTQLNPEQLKRIPLDEPLRDAIADYLRFRHKEARRRQMQYIGKLMRSADVVAIEQAWQLTQAGSEAARKIEHKLERWRDRLLEQGDEALPDVLIEFPALDRQVLRQLLRDAVKERQEGKPPAACRKLFRYLRQHSVVDGGSVS